MHADGRGGMPGLQKLHISGQAVQASGKDVSVDGGIRALSERCGRKIGTKVQLRREYDELHVMCAHRLKGYCK